MLDYTKVMQHLEARGKLRFHNRFQLNEADYPYLVRLAAYFLKDEEACQQLGMDLTKGILLLGPIGIGKSTWLQLMQELAVKQKRFYYTTCRQVGFEFIQDGFGVIQKYSKGDLHAFKTKAICFDDLGAENNFKYYGNECNVMAEILLSRYDLYVSHGIKTHLTSNLSAPEIEQLYSRRNRSRLREMMNLLAIPPDWKDKRR